MINHPLCERQEDTRSDLQSIRDKRDNHSHLGTSFFTVAMTLTCRFLVSGRKSRAPGEKTCAWGRTCKLHKERVGCEPVLTTAAYIQFNMKSQIKTCPQMIFTALGEYKLTFQCDLHILSIIKICSTNLYSWEKNTAITPGGCLKSKRRVIKFRLV